MAAEYNITHDKGTTFKLFALYKDSVGSAIDLANFTARMRNHRCFTFYGNNHERRVVLFIVVALLEAALQGSLP